MTRTYTTASEAETTDVGRAIGGELQPGEVVLLDGTLGAGKTAFVRGLAAGLGCDPGDVSSPTFTVVQAYAGRIPLQHVDLYRLKAEEVDDLGLDDLMPGHVVAVEWPDRWLSAPETAVRVTIERTGGDTRQIGVRPR
jgi:tRNA threonylcarbamoyladenosine biosynthesis protein TsaE